jgi:hypothetical protein
LFNLTSEAQRSQAGAEVVVPAQAGRERQIGVNLMAMRNSGSRL